MADQLEAAEARIARLMQQHDSACHLAQQMREVERMRSDVSVDEMPPGSHLRRVVLANRMWRYERDQLTAERDAMRAEVERMRPVVEAAQIYRDHGISSGVIDAVDAYRAQRKP